LETAPKNPKLFFFVRSCEKTQKGEDDDKEEETDMSLIRGSHQHQTLIWKLWQQTNKNPELFVVRSCEKNTEKGR
jgi:hypothetical protein